jgi:hypothetical protein
MRRIKALGLAAVVFVLAGCVGIPTSGGVVTGDVIGDRDEPDIIALPSGPRQGSSQEEILADFMLALRGPQSGYAIARQFLADSIADAWNPDAEAIIRTGIESIAPGPTENSLNYTVTTKAFVNSDGLYSESSPASQTLSYSFVQQDGEWRISAAPDAIVLSQSSFRVVFTEQTLYFFDPSYTFLVPDVRWFPTRSTLTSRIARELLDGPAPWLQQGVVLSAFPITTTVVSADVVSGTATVDLSSEALTATAEDRERMRQQLAASLDVTNVVMTVGGVEVLTPDSGTLPIRNPSVESAVLVGTGTAFGFDNGDGPTGLGQLGQQVSGAGATAAVLSNDKQTAAILSEAGVSVVRSGSAEPLIVDNRPGLIEPSLDPFRFVWSVQGASAASLHVFEVDGTEHPLTTTLPADARVVSIDVSRDGTRMLLYMTTGAGPYLAVAGIIRQQGTNIPVELGVLQPLPVSGSAPVDATWVSDRIVATVSHGAEASPITLVEIGGPSTPLSQVNDATTIAGGNTGADGLRVLAPDGVIWQPRGSGGWVETGLSASFLGTKQ